jgi:Txe/YoeB family toxin of Txe-Axe toxin-antitoxin module
MPTIVFHSSFEKRLKIFIKNNVKRKKGVQKTLRLFQIDTHHPSLNNEKLAGSDIWSIRIDKGNRLFYVKDGDNAIFFAVGPHDMYRVVG